jgi:hypothetical protein
MNVDHNDQICFLFDGGTERALFSIVDLLRISDSEVYIGPWLPFTEVFYLVL